MISDKDVTRLDVAMNDEVLVRVTDGAADRAEQFQTLGDREPLLADVLSDRFTNHVVHDDVRQSVVRRTGVDESGDAWMVESCEDLALSFKAAQDFISISPAFQHFDSD